MEIGARIAALGAEHEGLAVRLKIVEAGERRDVEERMEDDIGDAAGLKSRSRTERIISRGAVLCTALVTAVSIGIAYERILNSDLTQAEEIATSRTARTNAAVRIVFEKTFDVLGTAHDALVAFKDDGITDGPA